MKKLLIPTVGIALALLLVGCPTGTDDSVETKTYLVTVDVTPGNDGSESVTVSPGTAKADDTVTLTVSGLDDSNPARQVSLSSSSGISFFDSAGQDIGNPAIITADGEVTFTMPAEAVDITATFAPVPPPPPTYAVTVDVTPGNDGSESVTVSPGTAKADDTVTLTVSGLDDSNPARQVSLSSSSGISFFDSAGQDIGNPAIITADGEVTFTMPAEAVDITATFAPVPPEKYSLRAPDLYNTIPSDSLIYSDGLIEAEAGDTVTLELTLDTDRKVKLDVFEATGNGNSIVISYEDGPQATEFYITDSGNLTFTMPGADVSIEAHFMRSTEQMVIVVPVGIDTDAGESIYPKPVSYWPQNFKAVVFVNGLAPDRQVSYTGITGLGETVVFEAPPPGNVGKIFKVPETFVTITVTFEDKTYAVTVNDGGTGISANGEMVTANPANAAAGAIVTLTVQGLDGSSPARQVTLASDQVTLDPAVIRANGTVEFTMPAKAVDITATFEDKTYAVTVNDDGTGISANGEMVTANPANAVAGAIVTLTVQGLDGSSPARQVTLASDQVTLDPAVIRANGTVEFTMPAEAVDIMATFEDKTYAVTVNDSGTGISANGEMVTANPANAAAGATVTLTVQGLDGSSPAREVTLSSPAGVSFTNAMSSDLGNSPTITANGEVTFTMPAMDVEILAFFMDTLLYTVTVDDEDSGINDESVSTHIVRLGAERNEVILTVSGLEEGRQVRFASKQVTIDPAVIRANGTATFIMPAENVIITAIFEAIPRYTVVVNYGSTPGSGESVTANVDDTAEENSPVTLTVSGLAEGRQVRFASEQVTFDPTLIRANGPVVFIMPAESVTITATFEEVQNYNVDLIVLEEDSSKGENVTVDRNRAKEIDLVTLTVMGLEEGRQVRLTSDQVTFDPAVIRANGTVEFTMPGEDVAITATFAPEPIYTITLIVKDADTSLGEAATINPSDTAKEGRILILNIEGLGNSSGPRKVRVTSEQIEISNYEQLINGGKLLTMPAMDVVITVTFIDS